MRKRLNKIFWLLVAVFVFLIFRSWFSFGEITDGDAPFYFPETLRELPNLPYLWLSQGLGSYSSLFSSFPYLVLPLKLLSVLGLPWVLIERIAWYWPFLGLSIFSSWYLLKTVLPEVKFRFVAPLVYLFNTYILMIVGGGQASIFLPYAIAPLVLGLFINLLTSSRVNELKSLIITGVVLAVQVMFEPRIAFITMIALGVYCLLFINELTHSAPKFRGYVRGRRVVNLIKNLGIPFTIAGLLHFYWILPSLVLRKTSFSPTLTSSGWAEFLSFADFSDSFSLLHPNWPENIFGRTYFFRPEFLILPILAFISLLFINELKNSRVKKNVLVFALLGIVGAFLAKGTSPPLGGVYLWLFENIPGMNLFRDPTKFYVLTALSYSVLIPFSVEQIYLYLKKKLGN